MTDHLRGLLLGDGAPSLRDHFGRIWRFALVSGTGLTLDVVLFLTLVHVGIAPFLANAVSSTCAVTFVYFASVRRVFRYHERFVVAMFAAYAFYQLCGILAGSWVVGALVGLGLIPLIAKAVTVPVTFGCNYLFMWWLTASPERWIQTR